jgi:hypothetical protein
MQTPNFYQPQPNHLQLSQNIMNRIMQRPNFLGAEPPVRIIGRCVPERLQFTFELNRQLPGMTWVMDNGRDPMNTFVRALRAAENSPAIHLEDDAILCENFLHRAMLEIAKNPFSVIQLFSMKPEDLTAGSRWDAYFISAVCFYLPTGYSRRLADYAPTWPKRHLNPNAVDVMLKHWLKKERRMEEHWIVVPNLADHRVGPSSIDRTRPECRRSLTFKP